MVSPEGCVGILGLGILLELLQLYFADNEKCLFDEVEYLKVNTLQKGCGTPSRKRGF
jgi:hypothetical protein